MSLQNRWEPRSSSQLQGQKMLSEGRVRRIHTHTLFSSSFHGRLSPQISLCDPHPTVFLSFSFFLWIQTGFEAKADFVLSRVVHLLTNLPASTSNFTMTLKKYTQMYRYNCPKMIKYSFYKISTMFSNRNGTVERDFLPRLKT